MTESPPRPSPTPDNAPSVWRLLWSPKAMAWWARYRPLASLRIGTLALSVGLGSIPAYIFGTIDEPFAEPAGPILASIAWLWLAIIVLGHAWTWFLRDSVLRPGRFDGWLVVLLAAVPGMSLIALDSGLSGYRDALQYASYGSTIPAWPMLPEWIRQATNTCLWFFLGMFLWLSLGVFATRSLSALPPIDASNACASCHYDLRGTRAAGIGRCPECGAAVGAEAPGE